LADVAAFYYFYIVLMVIIIILLACLVYDVTDAIRKDSARYWNVLSCGQNSSMEKLCLTDKPLNDMCMTTLKGVIF